MQCRAKLQSSARRLLAAGALSCVTPRKHLVGEWVSGSLFSRFFTSFDKLCLPLCVTGFEALLGRFILWPSTRKTGDKPRGLSAEKEPCFLQKSEGPTSKDRGPSLGSWLLPGDGRSLHAPPLTPAASVRVGSALMARILVFKCASPSQLGSGSSAYTFPMEASTTFTMGGTGMVSDCFLRMPSSFVRDLWRLEHRR